MVDHLANEKGCAVDQRLQLQLVNAYDFGLGDLLFYLFGDLQDSYHESHPQKARSSAISWAFSLKQVSLYSSTTNTNHQPKCRWERPETRSVSGLACRLDGLVAMWEHDEDELKGDDLKFFARLGLAWARGVPMLPMVAYKYVLLWMGEILHHLGRLKPIYQLVQDFFHPQQDKWFCLLVESLLCCLNPILTICVVLCGLKSPIPPTGVSNPCNKSSDCGSFSHFQALTHICLNPQTVSLYMAYIPITSHSWNKNC